MYLLALTPIGHNLSYDTSQQQCLTEFRSFSPVIVGNIIVIVIHAGGKKTSQNENERSSKHKYTAVI